MKNRIYQSYNNKIDAWVKYKIMPDGMAKIIDTKQTLPKVKFKGIKIK